VEYSEKYRAQIKTASTLDLFAGVWLMISPLILVSHNSSAMWSDALPGIAIALLALYRIQNPASAVWLSWINVLLGIWILISPWLLRFSGHLKPTVNNVITGGIVIAMAGWSLLATTAMRHGAAGEHIAH